MSDYIKDRLKDNSQNLKSFLEFTHMNASIIKYIILSKNLNVHFNFHLFIHSFIHNFQGKFISHFSEEASLFIHFG